MPFRKGIEILFSLREKYKDEGDDFMQMFGKLLMNSLYGENISKDITEELDFILKIGQAQNMMRSFWDFWRLPNGEHLVKLKQDDGFGCETDLKNTMPTHLGSFIVNNSKKIMKIFIPESDGLKTKNVYDSDTDSLYNEKNTSGCFR